MTAGLIQLLAALSAIAPAVGLVLLDRWSSPLLPPTPYLSAADQAFAEGRRCTTACYGWSYGPPEQCAEPADHWGACSP